MKKHKNTRKNVHVKKRYLGNSVKTLENLKNVNIQKMDF